MTELEEQLRRSLELAQRRVAPLTVRAVRAFVNQLDLGVDEVSKALGLSRKTVTAIATYRIHADVPDLGPERVRWLKKRAIKKDSKGEYYDAATVRDAFANMPRIVPKVRSTVRGRAA